MPNQVIQQIHNLWTALEEIDGLIAVPSAWRKCVADDFANFKCFLQTSGHIARWVPCSRCGCDHEVITLPNGSLVGVCRCHQIGVHDLELARDDIALWQLNLPKFARAICKAF